MEAEAPRPPSRLGVPGSSGKSALAAIGLSSLEIRVYRALVTLRESPPDKLRRMLGLAQGEADLTFAALADKGLLVTADHPRRLVAVPPDVAGEVLLHERMAELQATRVELAMLAREYRSAVTAEMASELIEIVPKEAVPRLNLQLNRQATEEVMWVNAHPYLVPVETSEEDELERLAQGVKYRCIYARSTLDDPGLLDIIRRDLAAGEQARVIDSVPLKMGVVDRRIGLLPLLPGLPGAATNWLLVHRCSLLDALMALFETMWLSALPLDGVVGPAEIDVTSRDLASEDTRLLTLLLAGITDEAVARQLGMSKRTVVRRVRQLMDRAGVASRMQLGWKASQLGWFSAASGRSAAEPVVKRPKSRGTDPPAMIADPNSQEDIP